MEKLEKYQIILSCTIITAGILLSSLLFSSKMPKSENITVTGSASKIVKSDSAKLGFELQAKASNQKEAFLVLKKNNPKVLAYLAQKGIDNANISLKSLNGYNTYKTYPNGNTSNEISGYNASQVYEISSKDVEKIKEISTDIQTLADNGIEITIYQPEYFYSDLASIKVDLLKEATKDAKQRATSMLGAAGARVGKVKQMRMGVFQITPPDSTSVSDMGMNDTSTIDKKVTAVSSVVFKVK